MLSLLYPKYLNMLGIKVAIFENLKNMKTKFWTVDKATQN